MISRSFLDNLDNSWSSDNIIITGTGLAVCDHHVTLSRNTLWHNNLKTFMSCLQVRPDWASDSDKGSIHLSLNLMILRSQYDGRTRHDSRRSILGRRSEGREGLNREWWVALRAGYDKLRGEGVYRVEAERVVEW